VSLIDSFLWWLNSFLLALFVKSRSLLVFFFVFLNDFVHLLVSNLTGFFCTLHEELGQNVLGKVRIIWIATEATSLSE